MYSIYTVGEAICHSVLLGILLGFVKSAVYFCRAVICDQPNMKRSFFRNVSRMVAWQFDFIADILLWLTAAVSVSLLVYSEGGTFRIAYLPGMAFGFLLFSLTVGRFLAFLSEKTALVLRRTVGLLFRILLFPLHVTVKALIRFAVFLFYRFKSVSVCRREDKEDREWREKWLLPVKNDGI